MTRLLTLLMLLAATATATAAEAPHLVVAPMTGALDDSTRETLAEQLSTTISCVVTLSPSDVRSLRQSSVAIRKFGGEPEKVFATWAAEPALRKVGDELVLDVKVRRRSDGKELGVATVKEAKLERLLAAMDGLAKRLCEVVAAHPADPVEIAVDEETPAPAKKAKKTK